MDFNMTDLLSMYGLVTELYLTLVTPWTVALQAPLSMEFSRQEYWSRLSFLSPGILPNPGIRPRSPALQVNSLPTKPPGKPQACIEYHQFRYPINDSS